MSRLMVLTAYLALIAIGGGALGVQSAHAECIALEGNLSGYRTWCFASQGMGCGTGLVCQREYCVGCGGTGFREICVNASDGCYYTYCAGQVCA
jgi:hypothetical protein